MLTRSQQTGLAITFRKKMIGNNSNGHPMSDKQKEAA